MLFLHHLLDPGPPRSHWLAIKVVKSVFESTGMRPCPATKLEGEFAESERR